MANIQFKHENVIITTQQQTPENIKEDLKNALEALYTIGAIETLPSFGKNDAPVAFPDDTEAVEPKAEPEPEPKPEPEPAPAADAEPVTKADVQAVVKSALSQGLRQEVVETFGKYGAKKIGEINADDYPAVIADLRQVIGG